MATKKETIESRYREIVARQGFKWENCRVLVFGFKTEADAKAFHYETLSGGFPEHFRYDWQAGYGCSPGKAGNLREIRGDGCAVWRRAEAV